MTVNSVRDRIQNGIFVDNATLKRSHHHHRFDGRTRLEDVSDGTVTHHIFLRPRQVIWVIGRAIGHRQHFTSADIHQHSAAGFGFVERHGVVQLAVNQRLQTFIDTQGQVVRGLAVG
ncbi:hypothetical protein D3C72_1359610 [compost metagenome]